MISTISISKVREASRRLALVRLRSVPRVKSFASIYTGPNPPKGWVSIGPGPKGGMRWVSPARAKRLQQDGKEIDQKNAYDEVKKRREETKKRLEDRLRKMQEEAGGDETTKKEPTEADVAKERIKNGMPAFKYENPPYDKGKLGITREQKIALPEEEVNLKELLTVQRTVDPAKVDYFINGGKSPAVGEPMAPGSNFLNVGPWAVRTADGKLYLEDGNHRLSAMAAKGEKTAKIKVVQLDKNGRWIHAPKNDTPRYEGGSVRELLKKNDAVTSKFHSSLKEKVDVVANKIQSIRENSTSLRNEIGVISDANAHWWNIDNPDMQPIRDKINQLNGQISANNDKMAEEEKKYKEIFRQTFREHFGEPRPEKKLSQITREPVGFGKMSLKTVKQKFAGATEFLEGILHIDTKEMGIKKEKSRRARYDNFDSICMSGNESVGVYVHEIAHHLEYKNKEIFDAAKAFLKERAGDEPMKKMSSDFTWKTGYKAYEIGVKDEFDKAFGTDARYVGKHYPYNTEIISMGLQKMYEDPVRFAAQDPEYFNFLVGVVTGQFGGKRT